MPYALVTIGLILVITGARDTQAALAKELREDFTGEGNFLWWITAIGSVGALGYLEPLRAFSRIFMTLILVSMILSNEGFFNKFIDAMRQGPVSPPVPEKAAAIAGPSGSPFPREMVKSGTEAAKTFGAGGNPLEAIGKTLFGAPKVMGGEAVSLFKSLFGFFL